MILNYEVVTRENLQEVKNFVNSSPLLAFDCEVVSEYVVLFSFGTAERQFLVDVVRDIALAREVVHYIKDNAKALVMHNAKYDYKQIRTTFEVTLDMPIYDTMLASLVLNTGRDLGSGYHSLANLTRLYVDPYAYSDQLYFGLPAVTKAVRETFSQYPFSEEQLTYSALDSYFTYCLFIKISSALEAENLRDVFLLETEFFKVLVDMELNGLPLNVDKWQELSLRNKEIADNLLSELKTTVADINWNSPRQVGKVFKSLGIEAKILDKKTGEYKDSVSRDALSDFKHPVVELYLKYREAFKLYSTYGMSFVAKHYNPFTKRVHSNFFQILDTGRTSSSNPNCQNIPHSREFRECFEAPEGYMIIKADYSQFEARVLASLSREPAMIEAFESGKDFHTETAKKIYGREDIDEKSEERRTAKSVGFAILFGGGPKTIHEKYGIPLQDSKRLVENYFKAFPVLKGYFDKGSVEALRSGYIVIDDVIKRKSYLPSTALYKAYKRLCELGYNYQYQVNKIASEVSRKFRNYRPQGTAATIAKLAGINLRKAIKNYDAQLLSLVHDEYVIMCKKEEVEEVSALTKRIMEEAASVFSSVPIRVDITVSTTW